MLTSIIIPTRNKAKYLDLTLASFTIQSHVDFELVMIDDGSEDDSGLLIDRYRDLLNIKYIRQSHGGRSIARNVGIDKAEGDLLIFSDDDRIVSPDFVASHVNAHNSQLCSARAVVGRKCRVLSFWVQGELPLKESDFLYMMARGFGESHAFLHKTDQQLIESTSLVRNFHETMKGYTLPDASDNYSFITETYSNELIGFHFPWMFGTTANMSVAASQVKSIGGFDPKYAGWGMEDTDLSYRLFRNGVRFIVNPSSINFHQVHPVNDIWNDFGHNIYYFCNKFGSLEAYLFWQWISKKIRMHDANELMEIVQQTGTSQLTHELIKVFKELAEVTYKHGKMVR